MERRFSRFVLHSPLRINSLKMISILIPTYNYNVVSLVNEILKQCIESKIVFEIIVWDDTSTEFIGENRKLIDFHNNVHCFENAKNLGRTQTRALLSEKAQYDWLLFLDADVFPVHHNFIQNYLNTISTEFPVINGGIQYQDIEIANHKTLRYYYGKKRESVSSDIRKQNPYSAIFSANLCIRKNIFELYNFSENANLYGMDIYFAYQLFVNKINVLHIDNTVYHLGIEDNNVFFNKSIEAVKIRKQHLSKLPKIGEINSLMRYYLSLKKYKLNGIVYTFFYFSEPFLKKMIFKKKPILLCFDLYRLGIICNPKN